MLKFYLIICSITVICAVDSNTFTLNIVHYNDFHARFEETNSYGGTCTSAAPCIGGFARLTTLVREALDREKQSILLNAGDSFQGTLWYNILRWNVTQEFMNMLPHDAHALGNHEFDNGIEGLVPYLKHLTQPVVAANIIDDDEPTIQGLYEKSIVIEREGRKIGIIGVIVSSVPILATTGKLKFTEEVEAVKEEAEKLHSKGVDIIIVLSHSGLDKDKEIALNGGPYIDVIVGAHSHSLLYNGEVPENTAFVPDGPYPTVIYQNGTGRPVPIVQAAAHTAYLGELKLYFDSESNVVNWEGNAHFIGNEVEQATDVLARVNEYKPLIEELSNEEIGDSLVHLSSSCRCEECNLGNLICDALLDATIGKAQNGSWSYAHFCIINQGVIRADINPGAVSFGAVMTTNPYENNIEVFSLRGDYILEMLEYSVASFPSPRARRLQFAGLRATFDISLPENQRVTNVSIRCIECDVPRYEPLKIDQYYKIVANNFIADGGDGFTMISDNRFNTEVIGQDYDIIMKYIRRQSPIFADTDGRVTILNSC